MQITRKSREQEVLQEEWHKVDGSDLLLLKYPLLEELGIVKHCFTTRIGGVSEGIFGTMNLSFTRGDDKSAVEENYRRLAEAMEVDYENFVFTDQTHTVNVRKVSMADAGKGLVRERDYQDVDGLITNEPGLVLSTFFADCVPLYFVDPVHWAIGMSHSGWRGTVARMGRVSSMMTSTSLSISACGKVLWKTMSANNSTARGKCSTRNALYTTVSSLLV